MAKLTALSKEKETKTAAKKPKKRRIRPIKFIKEVISELKKVTWPTRKEVVTYTLAVLAFVGIFAVVIGVMDLGLEELMRLITGS